MCQHLKEEEDVGIPMVRENFTWKEYTQVSDKIVQNAAWFELPQLLEYMPLQDKRAWMRLHGIPGFVQRFIIVPRFARYDKEYLQPFQAIYQTPATA